MPALSVHDLDLQAVTELFGHHRSLDDKTLLTLKLLHKEQGRLVPTHGAVLLFGKDRQIHFPDAWVQCGRFRGTDKVHIFDQMEIHDHLPRAVDAIELFLKKHAFKSAEFSGMRRKDIWSIPLTMLREAIINALVHSDYSHRGTPIRIAFFDDRIDIESPGILLPGMTIEDMKSGVSRIRNPVIARIFRELGLVEQWGSGVKRIFAEAQQQGLPEPTITEIATGIRFTVRLREPVSVAGPEKRTSEQEAQSRAQSQAHSEQILVQLTSAPLSANELATLLGLQSKTGAFKRAIKQLLEAGLIEYTLPDTAQSRLQKYRLAGPEKRNHTQFKEQRAQSGAQSQAQSEQILALLTTAPLSANELVTLLGLRSKTGAFKRVMKNLLEAGLIEYTLPDSVQSRLQKYRVTAARTLMRTSDE